VPALAEKAARASSMQANPVVLTRGQLEELLIRAI
jgi:alcohol dehydrogenase class IV